MAIAASLMLFHNHNGITMSQASYPNAALQVAIEQLRAAIEKNLHELFTSGSYAETKFFVAGIRTERGVVFKHDDKLYIDPELVTKTGSVTADDSYLFPCEINPQCCSIEFLEFMSDVSAGVAGKELCRPPMFSVFPPSEDLKPVELSELLQAFCAHYSLPHICANELLFEIEGHPQEALCQKWLAGFVRRWDSVCHEK